MTDQNQVKVKMIGVESAKDLEGTQADGILGLSPTQTDDGNNFMLQMKKKGIIEKLSFGVFIGKLPDKSYIDFGVDKKPDSSETPIWTYLHDSRYWRVPLSSIDYGSTRV